MRRAVRAALAGAFAIAAAAPVALAPQDAGALTAAHGQPAAPQHPVPGMKSLAEKLIGQLRTG